MPLVTCVDCGKQISDAAPACIHCGRPMKDLSRFHPIAASQPESQRSNAVFRCPKCGSDDVRRLSVVHASGLSTTQSSSSAVGLGVSDEGDLGLAGGVLSSSGTQETALARAAAPPTPMTVSTGPAATGGAITGTVAAAAIGSVVHSDWVLGLQFLVWAEQWPCWSDSRSIGSNTVRPRSIMTVTTVRKRLFGIAQSCVCAVGQSLSRSPLEERLRGAASAVLH